MDQRFPYNFGGGTPKQGHGFGPGYPQQNFQPGYNPQTQAVYPGQQPNFQYNQPYMMGQGQPSHGQIQAQYHPHQMHQMHQQMHQQQQQQQEFLQRQQQQLLEQQKKAEEEERRRLAEAQKQRDFQFQKQRLQAMGASRGSSKTIDDLFGKAMTGFASSSTKRRERPAPAPAPASAPPPAPAPAPAPNPSGQDDWSDFSQASSVSVSVAPPQLQSQPLRSIPNPTPNVGATASTTYDNLMQKSLVAMADPSSIAARQRSFTPPSVPKFIPQKDERTFQQSDKSRVWGSSVASSADQFSGLFVQEPEFDDFQSAPVAAVPSPTVVSQQSALPPWCHPTSPLVPSLFKRIFAKCRDSQDGHVDTNLVFPILSASGLPRPTLRSIWSVANKTTPGKLNETELYAVLGLVACAQSGQTDLTLAAIAGLPQAPVPSLTGVDFEEIQAEGHVASAAGVSGSTAPASSFPLGTLVGSSGERTPTPQPAPVPPAVVSNSVDDKYNVFRDTPSGSVQPTPSLPLQPLPTPSGVVKDGGSSSEGFAQSSTSLDKYSVFRDTPSGSLQPTPPPPPLQPSPTPSGDKDGGLSSEGFAPTSLDKYSVFRDTPSGSIQPSPSFPLEPSPTPGDKDGGSSSVGFAQPTASLDKYSVFQTIEAPSIEGEVKLEQPGVPAAPSSTGTDSFSAFQTAGTATDETAWGAFSQLSPSVSKSIDPISNAQMDTHFATSTSAAEAIAPKPTPQQQQPGIESEITLEEKSPESDASQPRTLLALASMGDDEKGAAEAKEASREAPVADSDDFGDFDSAFGTAAVTSVPTVPPVTVSDEFGEFTWTDKVSEAASGSGTKSSSFQRAESSMLAKVNVTSENLSDLSALADLTMQPVVAKSPATSDVSTADDSFRAFTSAEQPQGPSVSAPAAAPSIVSEFDLGMGDAKASESQVAELSTTGLESFHWDPTSVFKSNDSAPTATNFGGQVPMLGVQYESVAKEDNLHATAWRRCVEACCVDLETACNAVRQIDTSEVKDEILATEAGRKYFSGVTEIYRVARRIKASAHDIEDLGSLWTDLDTKWIPVRDFLSGTPLQPTPESLDFSSYVLPPGVSSPDTACGVSLLDVAKAERETLPRDWRGSSTTTSAENAATPNNGILAYGGRRYFAACANYWCNRVESVLPALPLRNPLL